MIVEVPQNIEYYPKYVGWYVFTTKEGALNAEKKGEAPEDFLIKPLMGNTVLTYPGMLWVWKKLGENEFGVVSP